MTHAELEAICVAAAEAGAQRLRELFGGPRQISLKGRIDLVTDGDRAAEERILALLHERAPGAAILAEESGASGKGEVRFVVDPLDGTTNYAHGIPIFTCTVAAEEKGVPVAGCTVDPMRGETYRGCRGRGAFLNDAPLRASRARVVRSRSVAKKRSDSFSMAVAWALRPRSGALTVNHARVAKAIRATPMATA